MLRLLRALRQKLLVPLLRSRHPPEHTARGVLVGLTIALTPTVGIQMPAVVVLWLVVRRLAARWDYNVVVALAWCLVTNVATAPPLYYLYIVTGRILLGRWDELKSYDSFSERLTGAVPADSGWLESAWLTLSNLFENFGVPLFVGSLPWTALGAWLGYVWSLRLLQRIERIRLERRARRARRRAADRPTRP